MCKCKISDGDAVHILLATVKTLGNNVNKLILIKSSVRRSHLCLRQEHAKKYSVIIIR